MPPEILILAAVPIVGFIAGFVNTLAGSGSLITLPVLILLGLPANVANGTNRVGILVQNLSATWGFRRPCSWSRVTWAARTPGVGATIRPSRPSR